VLLLSVICREQFFEAAKLNAQRDFQRDPKDAQVCSDNACSGRARSSAISHCCQDCCCLVLSLGSWLTNC